MQTSQVWYDFSIVVISDDLVNRLAVRRRLWAACRPRTNRKRQTPPETRLRWTWTRIWSWTWDDGTAASASRWRWWPSTASSFWRVSPATCAPASSSCETSACTPPPTTTSSRWPFLTYSPSYSVSSCQLLAILQNSGHIFHAISRVKFSMETQWDSMWNTIHGILRDRYLAASSPISAF